MSPKTRTPDSDSLTLVLGGTGKTGRRVVAGLRARGRSVRVGSRSADPRFDWQDPSTWDAVLEGVHHVYVSFHPDLAVPGATDAIRTLTERAVAHGIKHLVLLSGRGEEEAQRCERIVQESGIDWTILRASWFAQNFSEGFLRDFVVAGEIALPVGDVREPFVDADDIAEIAIAALTEDGHTGQLYELTGPRLMSFTDAVQELSQATGRSIRYQQIPMDDFIHGLVEHGVPEDYVGLLRYLFTEVLDGRNASLADGVQRALGRAPRDFADYARDAAEAGAWAEEALR